VEHDDKGCEDFHRDGMSHAYYGNPEDQQSPIQAIQDNILDCAVAVVHMREAVAQTIQMLARKCPMVVNLEDNEEVTALEYAVLNDAIDLDTIQCIQRASCQTWKQTQLTSRRASMPSCKSDLNGPCRQDSCSTVATEDDDRSHEESGLC